MENGVIVDGILNESIPRLSKFCSSDIIRGQEILSQTSFHIPFGYAVSPVEIKNTTKRPLKVSLPEGKKLFLGPGAKGNVSNKALEHPPLMKLIENGDVEVLGRENGKGSSGGGKSQGISSSQQGHGGGSAMRRSGDR